MHKNNSYMVKKFYVFLGYANIWYLRLENPCVLMKLNAFAGFMFLFLSYTDLQYLAMLKQ